ncbi:PREDICTED: peroxisomal and mitochondrial division factor 2-like [Nelumbo nucifera]|uniref:Peroxisomal and mitochondrial division factor 2-like n=2 Tax=Nelumbo nucifera TaxID=4432 RepID=A0A1U8B2E4_NELNU|nr:PREDICTED: peroxisomal and mitochondrial division factor 2-like [Nelumbo nucifera]DAD37637.1 TPA_asm: hypothetical protein HUJ06_008278 [Nelumbo nucifera]
MADEEIVNSVASDVNGKGPEKESLDSKRDLDLDKKVSELNRRIEVLEQEKSGLLRDKGENDEKIKLLTEEIEGFKRNQEDMEVRLGEMQRQIDESGEDKKALQVIAARAAELETEVFRLQHDLSSSMSESEEALRELQEVKDAYEELKQSNLHKESMVKALEMEKVCLLERIDGEVGVLKKAKAENEGRILYLEEKLSMVEAKEAKNREESNKIEGEAMVKISEQEIKILQLLNEVKGLEANIANKSLDLVKLEKEKDEIEAAKRSLEEALSQSKEKIKEKEAQVSQLQQELLSSNNFVMELKNRETACKSSMVDAENGSKCIKLQWPTAVASTGTLAAAAALFYLSYAKRR